MISSKNKLILEAYADADWAGDTQTRRSTTDNLFLLGKSPMQWITKRQSCIALSSEEVEYVSAANAAQELLWLTKFLEDLSLPQDQPISIFEDNQSCIKMTENEKHARRSNHINIRFYAINKLKEEGIIDMQFLSNQVDDSPHTHQT